MSYRILSLDGGGAWSMIQVRALIQLYGEAATGHQVLRNFDLAAANSGGSLVLAGLVEDLALGEVLQYFNDPDKRHSLFPPTTSIVDPVLNRSLGVGPKYDARAKLPAIERLLPQTGDRPLAGSMAQVPGPGGAPVHLLIIGFDYDRNRAVFFRSAPASMPDWGDGAPAEISLAGAVHASTNAPVNYFDAPAELPGAADRFWDGGVTGCNNPTVAAIVEAAVLGQEPRDLRVLSLGTASVSLPLASPGMPASPLMTSRQVSSLAADLGKLATAILDDPPDAATFIAHALTGGSAGLPPPAISRVVRMSPLVSPLPAAGGTFAPPAGWSVAQFQHLCGIDLAALAQTDFAFIDDYCTFWLRDAAPNQPIRANGAVFDPQLPEIGYAKFGEALAAWQALMPPIDGLGPQDAAAAAPAV
jgi:uncharacterized protein